MNKLNIYITRGQVASMEYPVNVSAKDIEIIIEEVKKLQPYKTTALIIIERQGKAKITLEALSLAECLEKRNRLYPDWKIIKQYGR